MTGKVVCRAATARRWGDVEAVFRGCGNARRCWCAYWYLSNRAFKEGWGEANAATLRERVAAGEEPGVIAYVEGEPAGWCAVAPRGKHDRLNRSKHFAPVDDRDVWSIVCFVVRTGYRRHGLMRRLIDAAVAHARRQGAAMVEAYPIEPGPKTGSADLYVGTVAAFADAGFAEVARRLPRRPVMRLEAGPSRTARRAAGRAGRAA